RPVHDRPSAARRLGCAALGGRPGQRGRTRAVGLCFWRAGWRGIGGFTRVLAAVTVVAAPVHAGMATISGPLARDHDSGWLVLLALLAPMLVGLAAAATAAAAASPGTASTTHSRASWRLPVGLALIVAGAGAWAYLLSVLSSLSTISHWYGADASLAA